MTPAELIQWHEREAERFDAGGRGWSADGHEAQAEAWFEDAAFHRSAAETVRRLVDIAHRLVKWDRDFPKGPCPASGERQHDQIIHDARALAGAPTPERKAEP